MENKELVRLLAMIGGIIGLIESILSLIGWGFYTVFPFAAIIGLIVAILVLLSIFQGKPVPYEALYLIIFGIIMIIFSSTVGGILVLVGGILWQINK